MNSVFFNAKEKHIWVTINDCSPKLMLAAKMPEAHITLAHILKAAGVTARDDFMQSSDVDYCHEEGFSEGEAGLIIRNSLRLL